MKIIVKRRVDGPSVPELGTPTSVVFNSVTVPLDRPSTGPAAIASYEIQRSTNGTTWTTAASGPAIFGNPPTQYVDGGRLADTTYYYRARATDTSGRVSAYSATVSVTTPTAPSTSDGTLLLGGGFEGFAVQSVASQQAIATSTPQPGESYRASMTGANNIVQIVSSPVITGSRAYRSRVIREGANTKRAELRVISPTDSYANPRSTPVWCGFSFRVLTWDNVEAVVGQWHQRGLTGNACMSWLITAGGVLSVWHRRQTTVGGAQTNNGTVPTVPIVVGTTYHCVSRIVWDYRSTGNGSLQAWVNGTQYVNYSGPIGYAGNVAGEEDLIPYFKLGIYKYAYRYSGTDGDVMETIHDNLKIMGADGSYAGVLPG